MSNTPPQQRGGQAADALHELQRLASMYDHVSTTEGKFVAGELRALAARLQIGESSAPPAPSVGGVVEMRDTLGCALEDLLDDTQHKHHNCGELGCPVLHARTVVAEWRAALAREGGV